MKVYALVLLAGLGISNAHAVPVNDEFCGSYTTQPITMSPFRKVVHAFTVPNVNRPVYVVPANEAVAEALAKLQQGESYCVKGTASGDRVVTAYAVVVR